MNKIELGQKKSAVDLTALAFGVVVLGITVSIGGVILNKMATTQITNADTSFVRNETVTVNEAGATISNGWFKSLDIIVNNSADKSLIKTANATVTVNDYGSATITNASCKGSTICAGPWDISYTIYNKSDARFALPDKATIGLAEYGNWFKILVIVGVAAVVLSIIFMAFGRGGGGEEATVAY